MKIYEVTCVTEAVAAAFRKLIPQLDPDIPAPGTDRLREIIESGNAKIFVAEEKVVLGTLTLVFQKIPTGEKAWIEDVVVDESARGKGIGEKLLLHAIDCAAKKGVTKIDLTSRQERSPANRLYQKLGFEKRETNVYRLTVVGDNNKSL